MANNLFTGNNGVIATDAAAGVLMSTKFNEANCVIVQRIGNPIASWKPGREINAFTTFEASKCYLIKMLANADITDIAVPPLGGGGGGNITPAAPTSAITDDTAKTFNWTHPAGYTTTDEETTIDGGTTWTAAVKPLTVGPVNKAPGQVGVRVKAISGRNVSSTLFNTVAFTGYVFLDTFTGAAGAYSTHTPEFGTATDAVSNITLDGNGKGVFPSSGAGVLVVNGTIPRSRRVTVVIASMAGTSSSVSVRMMHNSDSSKFLYAVIGKVSDTVGQHYITDESGMLVNNTTAPMSYPATFVVDISGEVLHSTINAGDAQSAPATLAAYITDRVEIVTIDGAVIDSILVETL